MNNLTRKVVLIAALTMLLFGEARAAFIDLGSISFTGTFTRNGEFDYGNPSAQPFGTFGNLAIQDATGIFLPHVSAGGSLAMSTPDLPGWGEPSSDLLWTAGGFSFETTLVAITGPSYNKHVLGTLDLSGHGFDATAFGLGAYSYWSFQSNSDNPEIALTIRTQYYTEVSEEASMAALCSISLLGFWMACPRSRRVRIVE